MVVQEAGSRNSGQCDTLQVWSWLWVLPAMSKNIVDSICSMNASPRLVCQRDITASFIIPVLINMWPDQSLAHNVWIIIMCHMDGKEYSKYLATAHIKNMASVIFPTLGWVMLSHTFSCHYSYVSSCYTKTKCMQPLICVISCVFCRSGPITRRNPSRRLCKCRRRRSEWLTTDPYTSLKSATPCISTPRT